MKLLPIFATVLLATVFVLGSNACKKNDKLDCSIVTGATFSSNAGQVATLLESKCATAGCHTTGGAGAAHWAWVATYDTVQQHFGHMLEAVESGEMPPAGSIQLTEEEKDRLECWKESGYPE